MINKAKKFAFAKLGDWVERMDLQSPSLSQQVQKGLLATYLNAKANGTTLHETISDAGFRCYSQFEEDGIILYLMAMVGMKSRRVVEICCGVGRECMAANLIINHGFKGFLFDGNPRRGPATRGFFGRQGESLLANPEVPPAGIPRNNINRLLSDAGAAGEVDLLSLDMDGNDYHIWDAIDAINPRVCVFETHDIVPGDRALTIPYADSFDAWGKPGAEADFRGVSLAAMVKLSTRKGYTMVGSHRHGFNVFFVRNDLMNAHLREVSIAEVHDNDWTRQGQRERWPLVRDMPWISV